MSSSAVRGAILVALAVLLGFLILRGTTDRTEIPITAGQAPVVEATVEPTPTPESGIVALPTVPPAADTSTARPNSQVTILVANGTDISGQAGRLTDRLRNQGFNSQPAKNADAQATSTIFYRPGFAVEAEVVRETLGSLTTPVSPMPVPDPSIGTDIDLGNVDVLILVGNDSLAQS